MWLAALVVRLQFQAAPESGGRQPQHPSRRYPLFSLCPDPSRRTGPGKRHEALVVAGPVLCVAGREEQSDELTAWIFCPTLTRHSHLMSTQRGNFHLPGDLRTAGGTPHFLGHSHLMGAQRGFLSDADPAHDMPGDLRTKLGRT